ncbi:TetR/AcrR family transcriptional regulator [Pseudomonas sp. dw_358]|uniref:TetR/AcrR family transcriptional regulator n=1 Tax=Pseudomonas sp. dw_358 TaxID=2720083 RepID=UPI001BD228F8|nr:TetR/AcrR family transcriptional regulator [Pseudomonas sp. dw_358]
MARPRSDEKRNAILAAATRIISAQGLSAPTAAIAKAAGVSNGALFTYFETKSDLLNALYLHLKAELAKSTMITVAPHEDVHEQLRSVWDQWLHWAISHPHERKAIACLAVCEDLTPATREAASQAFSEVAGLLDRVRANGSMRDTPLLFVGSLVMALMDATTQYMADDKAHASVHLRTGFEALWRMLG